MEVIVIHDDSGIIGVYEVPEHLTPQEAFELACYKEKELPGEVAYDIVQTQKLDTKDYDAGDAKASRDALGQIMTAVRETRDEDAHPELEPEKDELQPWDDIDTNGRQGV